MKLSVAMCVYNGANYLREQLDSLLRQRRLPDELVICDDASTDGTLEIVRSFVAAAPFPARLEVNERNLGVSKNFEKAIGLCAGEIIATCDQDDYWMPEKLQKVEQAFINSPEVGFVFSDAEMVDERLNPLGARLWETTFPESIHHDFVSGRAFDILLSGCVVTGATMAFRSRYRSLVLPIPIFPTLLHDAWIAMLIAAVARVAFINEPLVKYRIHSGQAAGIGPPIWSIRPTYWVMPLAAYVPQEREKLRAVSERLKAMSAEFDGRKAARQLTHLEIRTRLPESYWPRFAIIMRELLMLRYHLYSDGLSSAVKDLRLR
jgi:glycosyltransferase involved in cell wall biosynthesis